MKRRTLGCAVALLALAGCGDNELGMERRHPNAAPETVLSSGPPDSTSVNSYHVEFHWSGTDRDGTIDHYDFIMVDHPMARSHVDGTPDDGDPTRVVVEVPTPDDPRWMGTSQTDSVFATLADTLRRPPVPGPHEREDDVRRTPFERWHTFFIRAVDNEGSADPTPDYRTFNSKNIAPIVRLRRPVVAGQEFSGPPVIVFRWDGEDPLDDFTSIAPVASRWVVLPSKLDLSRPGTSYASFPESLYSLPTRFQWSPWQRWDAADSLGRHTVVSSLVRIGDAPGAGYYIFTVQALDEAGAATPVFDWSTPGKNNTALVRVTGSIGPLLRVRDEYLGTQTFVGGSRPIRIDVAAGQPLRFRWVADTKHYGGEIIGYRYGWDIRDVDDDAEWSSWSRTTTSAPERSFNDGTHRFYVQVQDNAHSVAQAIYELPVHPVTRARPVLWVDDTDYLTDVTTERVEDERWVEVLSRLAGEGHFDFDLNADVFSVADNRREPPPIQKIFDYRAVVWSVRSNQRGQSALRTVAQFVDPLPTRNQNSAKSYNYVNVYLANGGRLWINGFRAARTLWPNERIRGHEFDPVNVTNWDDPLEAHPLGIDSVGTTSLLYAMGIEMFDVGSAIDSKRLGLAQFCKGLAPGDAADAAGAPSLGLGPLWTQVAGTSARANVEIYNMPRAMITQRDPLVPLPGISFTLYSYVSGLPQNEVTGFGYPDTADRQPVFVMAKSWPGEARYSRAMSGFEIFALTTESHVDLARYVLIHHFGVGTGVP